MRNLLTLLILLFSYHLSHSQISSEIVQSLKFRSIGPAFMTGRISDIVKDPTNASTWYVSVASGNAWKTTNSGTTWTPIFDNYPVYSTGCLAIDPVNPSVVWLGTGENQSQRSVGWGDGIYKSPDGGKSWKNMGLQLSEHIGKILIDPRDTDRIIVAAQGPLWKSGGDRGVFVSEDGGLNWFNTLFISENTGISDLAFDPNNPDIIYATSYQRRRHVGILVAGGPESRIYKSTDRGATWKKLGKGLPNGDLGRIAIAVSPQKTNVVYAAVSGSEEDGGFYRSEDYGESWVKQNDYQVVDPQYYGEIYCHPTRFDHVYVVDVWIHHTSNGGKDFERLNSSFKHVDNHSIVFDRNDPDYIMVGCDGGIYESWDNGDSWKYIDNLPIVQFYRVGIDNDKPFYNVYGGTQDNSTLAGPSQTTSRHGITNHDWTLVLGGDGFQARIDPENPNTVYAQSQYAGIVRYDRASGTRIDIRPREGLEDEPLRWHWDSPLIISPHNAKRLYYAAQKLFKSDDRGDSWQLVSADLSRGEDRNQRKVMDQLWQPEAIWKNVFTSPYGTIVSLSESPLKEGLIVVGTDDGQIQITTDGGASWKLSNRFSGVPDRCYVADVLTSNHDENVIYAVLNNHKEGDFKPYIIKTSNLGTSWQLISAAIDSNQAGWSIMEDHKDKNIVFFGSEFGLWCSLDGGLRWQQMKNGLPTIAVRDIEIQKEEDDLVLATFGRGFYILDDYSILREIDRTTAEPNLIFAIKDGLVFNQKGNLGYSEKGVFGTGFFTARNPEYGVRIRTYVSDVVEPAKDNRAADSYPNYQTLRAEDTELKPRLAISISDLEGNNIAQIPLANKTGFQEVFWDYRAQLQDDRGNEQTIPGSVESGLYTAQIVSLSDQGVSNLGGTQSFNVEYLKLSEEKQADDHYRFARKATKLFMDARNLRSDIEEELELVDNKLKQTVDPKVTIQLAEKRKQLIDLQYELLDDSTLRSRFEYYLPGIFSRIRQVTYRGTTWQITQTQRDQYELAESELKRIQDEYKSIVSPN